MPISTNMTSIGVNWSERGGTSMNGFGCSVSQNGGISFSPSVSVSVPVYTKMTQKDIEKITAMKLHSMLDDIEKLDPKVASLLREQYLR